MIALVFLWHWKRVREGWQRAGRLHQFRRDTGYRLLYLPASENRTTRILVARDALSGHEDATRELQKAIHDQTEFAKSVAATEASAMAQWVTEVISKQMGFGIKPTDDEAAA